MKELKFGNSQIIIQSFLGLKRQSQITSEAIGINPDDAQAHHRLGVAFAAQGQSESAIKELKTVIELDSGNSEARYLLALSFALNEQFDQATAEFREVLRGTPDNAQVHLELGSVLYKADQRSEARAVWEKVQTLGDDDLAKQAQKMLSRYA